MLLQLLADAAGSSHQVAGGEDSHLLHRHAAIGEGAHGRLGGEVDRVLVGVLAELGHMNPEDPDVITGHRVLLHPSLSYRVFRQAIGSIHAE